MEAQRSPLKLQTFVITKSVCLFIPFTSKDITNPTEALNIQESYPVNVDFDIRVNEQESIYAIQVIISINADQKPGYSIEVHGTCFFGFENADLSEEKKTELLLWSGVSICISSIRAYVGNVTAYYPMGKIMFHSIDMQDLISKSHKVEDEK